MLTDIQKVGRQNRSRQNMLYLGQQNRLIKRQNRTICAWHTTDFCRAISSADKIGWFHWSYDIPLRKNLVLWPSPLTYAMKFNHKHKFLRLVK